MKILLLKGAFDDRIVTAYAIYLMRQLCPEHIIGVNFNFQGEEIFSHTIKIANLNKVTYSKWDIVIYFDSVIQSKAFSVQSKVLKLPSIFLSFSEKAIHQPIMTINPINRIVNCYRPNPKIQGKNFDSYAIFCRRSTFIFNFTAKELENENFDSFIHIITDEDYNLAIVKRIISVIGGSPNTKLYIYGNHFEKQFINIELYDNVFFEVYDESNPINLSSNSIIIGSGQPIYESILNNIPAIIVGERGLGGIMADKLLKKQYLTDFRGRIGAELFEAIPASILGGEISTILSRLKNNEYEALPLSKDIKRFEENYLDIVGIIGYVISVNKQLVSSDYLKLIPKVNPLVTIELVNDEQYVIFLNRNPTFVLGKNEYNIVSKINSIDNISHIINSAILEYKSSKNIIYTFFKGLYSSNIIYFS
jgi:hypothetical protein